MESYKTMETMEEALDKLGCRQNFGQGPVEPVDGAEPHALLDIASLALYGCHALPVRFKILLDRLFSVLRPDQVVQVLRGFGWTQEDYARGYILNEANGASLDRFNLCSPEEEPLVLQQFLRFGETRALTEQLLRSAAGGKPGHEQHAPQERVPPSREERAEQERTPPSTPAQPAPAPAPAPAPSTAPSREDDKRMSHALNFSLSARQSQPSAAPVSPKNAPSQHGSQHGPSPGQQSPQSHGLGSFLNRGSLPQPQSPPGGSPLNRLQNMQPFDFRKMAASAVRASPEPPGILNLRPPPPPAVPTSNMSQLPLPFSHSALGSVPLTAANLVASSFPGLISSAMAGAAGNKSPSTDLTSRTGSSDMGSEASDEDDSKGSALNLSRDNDKLWSSKRPASSAPSQHRSSKQPPSSYSPLKRESAWPSSPSQMPVNLGTQLINPATGKKRVQCNVCLKTFCDKGALKIHFSAVHLREMHRCTVEGCSMMFSSRRSRNRHSANPNPKLHSPHLRRKISPHDGRSAQAHPILLPPHQAQLGALNPLSFGGFPLLPPDPRDPRDPRNAAVAAAAAAAGGQSALDLKNSLGLSLKYEREHWERRERQRDRDDGVNMTSLSMDEDDDDDEEGIVVVGGADDDYDGPEDLQAKRPKLSVSDGDDNSNMDMDDDSQSALDLGTGHENGLDHPADLHGREHSEQSARSGRKRKSQNPTRCTQPASMDDLDSSSDGQDGMAGLDLRPKRREDHQDTEERQAREQDSVQPPHEESNSQDDQVFRLTKVQKGDSIRPPSDELAEDKKPVIKNEPEEARRDEVRDEHRDNPRDEHPNGEPSSPCSPPGSPAGSLAGSQTSSLGSHDEDGFYFPDGYNMDVPIDKDNPRRCPACGKVFQNHFGVKTHFQNVHLKLMHKCTVEGCNAAFPSKRSRDRHSANLNLHRKLLSTSSSGDKPAPLWGGMHPDLLARLYADPGHPGHPGHPVLMPPFGYSPLAFGHPLNNGRAGSTSPTSPRSPRSVDEELLGRPPKLDPFLGPFQAARSRSDPGGLAEGLTSSMTNHSDSLVAPQRRPSASSDS